MCSSLLHSSVASWALSPPEDPQGWRHVRLRQNGPNASGQTHYLSVSGLELYGEVRGLADEDLGEICESGMCEGEELDQLLTLCVHPLVQVKLHGRWRLLSENNGSMSSKM